MQWKKAAFYQRKGIALLCTLCPHACALTDDGEIGFCQVRRRNGKHIETATFASAVHYLDPIERKPFYHYKPGSKVLTLAAPGCNFRCLYCQNYRLSQFGRTPQALWRAEPVDPDSIVSTARKHNAAIGISYTEPSLAAELTLALAEAGQKKGIELIWKTNGFLSSYAIECLAPYLAAVNIDLKSVDNNKHYALTGAPVKPILESIAAFFEAGVWVEVSTPIIPKINANSVSLRKIAQAIYSVSKDIPWHLIRFTPAFKLQRLPPTPLDVLEKARHIACDVGLQYVYVERALGTKERNTFCPQCHYKLISREIWGMRHNALNHGKCPRCGLIIQGRW
ncbi:pyruvate-formate lyase-activating enzyme [Candidatus Thiomargarita nelsonii]|uniref:Pyruvate-formate lyase-activating enzyme n=1 Tax=Candidatus Thiomargarita nelsonii TaxID=1003181 RepID=A0A0A6P035_9GAMM|nr:pyruvate-formate lyase-activating enzyme [Candidatus Thiomargarita nelsonii]